MSFSDISRKLTTPESPVRYRLDQLERSGLVAGYRVELALSRLGMMFFKAQLYLATYDHADLKRLRSYCGKHPNITYFIEQIGDSPVEVELEVTGYAQFTDLINDLRSAFPTMIRNVETTLINRSRFKWVPYRELALSAE